jgi:hypothetical protein
MAIVMSDVSNALKKVLLPYIQDNFDKEHLLLDNIKKGDVQSINNTFYAPIRTSRHGGITNLANDGSTLVNGSSSIGQASVNTKIVTGTFDISDLVIKATKSNELAVESLLTQQASTLADDFAKGLNRQYYSDGVGVVAQVAGSTSGSVFTVATPNSSLDDGRSIDWYGTVNNDIAAAKYIQPGNYIGVGSAASGSAIVLSVSHSANGATGTITTSGDSTPTANDPVYIVDGAYAGAGTSEIQGVRAALSSSSGTSQYAGVARSTPGWTPQLGTAAQALTLAEMTDKYLAALEFSKMSDRFVILMNKTLYSKYGKILSALRRTVNETELIGGFAGLEFVGGRGKIGVFLDFDVPDGEVVIINLDTWVCCQVSPMEWLEDPSTGSLVRRPDRITYQATMVWYTNLMCLAPGANARLTQKTA